MEILSKLIQIKSVSGGEKEIQNYILSLLTSYASKAHYGYKPLNIKGNVVLRIPGIDSSSCLIFNAHTDTVSEGDTNLWDKDPFSGYLEAKKIYGVGASDNKSSVAILIKLAEFFINSKPDCDLFLTFTICEEVDGSGTRDVLDYLASKALKRYKSIAGIVCEPTALVSFGVAHKGNMFLKITTHGVSGHGASPINKKDHAVLKMIKVINKLEALNIKWKGVYKNKMLGVPTIGLSTSIAAGSVSTPNKFADSCVSTFDIRTTPEMHSKALLEIKKTISKLGKVEYLYPPAFFGNTDINEKIVNIFKDITKTKPVAFLGSTDMCFFTEKNIPAVIFGPGEPKMMHKPNEYCKIVNIEKCLGMFNQVIKEFARI